VSIESKIVNAINIFEKLRKTRYYESEQDEVLLKQYLKKNIDLKLPWYNNFNLDNNVIMYLRDIIKNGTDLMNRNIVVNTIHGVKGGEADNVVIRLDFTRNVNLNYDMNTDSELRCLYVACTRAFKKLHVVHSSTKYGYDNHLHLFNRRFA
jgi:superfamily I DNA/RNA helicase